jgi:hypothetical protein
LANIDISFRNNQAIYVKCDYYIIVSSYLLCYVGKEPEFKRMPQAMPYSGAQCIDGYNNIHVLSDNFGLVMVPRWNSFHIFVSQ